MFRHLLSALVSSLRIWNADAESWRDKVNQLESADYHQRNQAEVAISQDIIKDTGSLEYDLYQLLYLYSHSKDPEAKLRLLNIMQKVCVTYKEVLGKSAVGLEFKNHSEQYEGQDWGMVYVLGIRKESAADKAGLKKKDKILWCGTLSFQDHQHDADVMFDQYLDEYAPGENLKLIVLRGSQTHTLKITLEKMNNHFFKKIDDQPEKHQDEDNINALIKTIKQPLILPKQYDDGAFFSRWFKRQNNAQ